MQSSRTNSFNCLTFQAQSQHCPIDVICHYPENSCFVKEGEGEKPLLAYSLRHHAGWAAYHPYLPDWLRAFISHRAAQAGASLQALLPALLPTEQHQLPPTPGTAQGPPFIHLLPPWARGSCCCMLITRVILSSVPFLSLSLQLFLHLWELAQAKPGSESKTFADSCRPSFLCSLHVILFKCQDLGPDLQGT